MLADRDARIDAEQVTGQRSVWRDVYRVMRCPGPPCRHEGQYYWHDPEGKRHYRLKTHHLKALVKYVEQGGVLETHADVPDSVREQLYAEENQAAHSLRRTLTIEDLYRRYHNKPSPFKFGKKTSKSSADRARARNKNATATQSLTKFLISALPAFSQLLSEMQPAADNCWQSYRGTHYSRAARAA